MPIDTTGVGGASVAAVAEVIREALAQVRGTKNQPVYQALVLSVRGTIEDGTVPVGARLPSERQLAFALGLSRTTVQSAYRELEELGYLGSRPKSGTYVRARPEWARDQALPRGKEHLSRHAQVGGNTFLLDLMQAAAEPVRYSFETATVDPHLLPMRELHAVAEDLFSQRSPDWVSYSPTQGTLALRRAISQTLLPLRHLGHVDPEEVLILAGSMQGLDLIAKLLIEPGDAVVVENPTFPGAIQIFRNFGARLVGLPMDGQGLLVDQLSAVIERERPKLIYVQPTLHNPTGATLSQERRRVLLDTAKAYDVPLVEDDAYGLLADLNSLPPIKNADRDGHIIYLSTMSKILAPGLRVGYLVAPAGLVRELTQLKQLADLHTATLSQFLLEGWLGAGDVRGHLERCRRAYAERLSVGLNVLRATRLLVPWTEPKAGLYLFCRLPGGLSAAAVRKRSVQQGVIFATGDGFSVDDSFADYLRLCVSLADPPTLRAGIDRLVRIVTDMQAGG